VHTLRDFTLAEQEDERNQMLKGVRTYFFYANHWRGLPEIVKDHPEYDDFAWVPKRKLNEFMTKDYHDIFAPVTLTR